MGAYLGLELGSTRIKGVVIGEDHEVIGDAEAAWENGFKDGYWTYDLKDARDGVRRVLSKLRLGDVKAMAVSSMMHGYLAFDREDGLLVPFRTWRNTNTAEAAQALSRLFGRNTPLRWSVSHLYQAVLDDEPHLGRLSRLTTLAGQVHYELTGRNVLGAGDASGMFPLSDGRWDPESAEAFLDLAGLRWPELAPRPLTAGTPAGFLTEAGADYLGVSRSLVGLPLAPPEGDAGTGMVATNALSPRVGNVSAGTSVFAMVVLEKPLKTLNPTIDLVATPDGREVAMVHYNECTTRIDEWINLFGEAASLFGAEVERGELFRRLYERALEKGTLADFMRGRLREAVVELGDGLRALRQDEGVLIDSLTGHGGYFKSGRAGRVVMERTLGVPIRLLPHAGEGGAWGAAVLAAYLTSGQRPLADYVKTIFDRREEA